MKIQCKRLFKQMYNHGGEANCRVSYALQYCFASWIHRTSTKTGCIATTEPGAKMSSTSSFTRYGRSPAQSWGNSTMLVISTTRKWNLSHWLHGTHNTLRTRCKQQQTKTWIRSYQCLFNTDGSDLCPYIKIQSLNPPKDPHSWVIIITMSPDMQKLQKDFFTYF